MLKQVNLSVVCQGMVRLLVCLFAENPASSIILICQNTNNSTKVRIRLDEAFESLFTRYKNHATEKGWAKENDIIKFYLDGEAIQSDDTPEDLACENGVIIDVRISLAQA